MRKSTSLLSLLAFFLGIYSFASAQNAAQPTLEQSRSVIAKTAVTLRVAGQAVQTGKVYTGNLAKAVNHQHYAIAQHKAGNYANAIFHCRRARHLASLAIRANRYNVTRDQVSPDEVQVIIPAPTDAELDAEVESNLKNKANDDATVTLEGIEPSNN